MKHALGAESLPPGGDERPRVHRQRTSGMISDQQRGLLGQSVPTGRLQPEVELVQGIPDRLLSTHQRLVGTVEGVFGGRGDSLGDEALDRTLGLAPRGSALAGLAVAVGSSAGRPLPLCGGARCFTGGVDVDIGINHISAALRKSSRIDNSLPGSDLDIDVIVMLDGVPSLWNGIDRAGPKCRCWRNHGTANETHERTDARAALGSCARVVRETRLRLDPGRRHRCAGGHESRNVLHVLRRQARRPVGADSGGRERDLRRCGRAARGQRATVPARRDPRPPDGFLPHLRRVVGRRPDLGSRQRHPSRGRRAARAYQGIDRRAALPAARARPRAQTRGCEDSTWRSRPSR